MYAWRTIASKEGLRGIFFGWGPTFIGYSFQGAGKYGFYEVFKYTYGERLFPNTNKTVVYLAASASAEFLADLALCPFEAIKVRLQTTLPPMAPNARQAWNQVVAKEGYAGLYKGLVPLWGRQIPYTMVKFATFEETVSAIYRFLGKDKASYNSLQQTGVSFLGGYIAGIGCAVISHPADLMVSQLNAHRKAGESAGKAMGRIYGEIGFKGLWNGLPVRILMVSSDESSCTRGRMGLTDSDRYAHCLPMADLRLLQGHAGVADNRRALEGGGKLAPEAKTLQVAAGVRALDVGGVTRPISIPKGNLHALCTRARALRSSPRITLDLMSRF
jgi:solute carrier family 25 (mitochondrial phosphate transporter), member 3